MVSATGPAPFSANNNTSPAFDHFAITPSNSINEATMFRAIYVGVGGDIVVVSSKGNAVTYVGVPQGSILPVQGVRVNSTNTTASSLVGML